MEIFNRHSIYSKIEIYPKEIKIDPKDAEIISLGIAENVYIVEYVKSEDWDKYVKEKQQSKEPITQEDKKPPIPPTVKAALDTVLKDDPFYLGCTGLTLSEIYKTHQDWWVKAQQELKNQYIRAKMQIIDEYVSNR